MVQITQTGIAVPAENLPELRAEFKETGVARLPGFLSPRLCALILNRLSASGFEVRNETRPTSGAIFGTTFFMPFENPVMPALHFLLNRQELFEMVTKVSGISRPGNFVCRMHRTVPASEQHIAWHDDAIDFRVLGLNINLSAEEFGGGVFELRNPQRHLTAVVKHAGLGDAFLFRIGSGWQHRLTKVESGSRTVAVGWFRSEPDWQTMALAGLRTGSFVFSEAKGD